MTARAATGRNGRTRPGIRIGIVIRIVIPAGSSRFGAALDDELDHPPRPLAAIDRAPVPQVVMRESERAGTDDEQLGVGLRFWWQCAPVMTPANDLGRSAVGPDIMRIVEDIQPPWPMPPPPRPVPALEFPAGAILVEPRCPPCFVEISARHQMGMTVTLEAILGPQQTAHGTRLTALADRAARRRSRCRDYRFPRTNAESPRRSLHAAHPETTAPGIRCERIRRSKHR